MREIIEGSSSIGLTFVLIVHSIATHYYKFGISSVVFYNLFDPKHNLSAFSPYYANIVIVIKY